MRALITLAIALNLTLYSTVSAITCMGGGGPGAWYNISKRFKPDINWFERPLTTKDFLFWENTGRLIFRTKTDYLRTFVIGSGFTTTFTRMDRPMSRVVDPNNRYVVTQGKPELYDTEEKGWLNFQGPENPLIHLFWEQGSLYTLSEKLTTSGRQHFKVHKYTPETNSTELTCEFSMDPTSRDRVRIAQGFHYPNVLLYGVDEIQPGNQAIYTYPVNIETCSFQSQGLTLQHYGGRVINVYNFEGNGAVGVRTDSPEMNFAYAENGVCSPYKVDGIPMVVDLKRPTLASWTTEKGLQISRLQEKETFYLLKDSGIRTLGRNDVQMTSDQEKIYISPLREGKSCREIGEIELKRRD